MTIKLIALDIDDTLLSSQGKILPSTLTAIKACLERGLKIVLCTGRPLAGVKPYLTELGVARPEQYVVTYNGAVIESITGQVVAKQLIDNAGYRTLTAFAAAHDIPFNVLDENSQIYTADHDVDFITAVQAVENEAGLFIRQPEELPANFAIAKGLFVGTQDLLDGVEDSVRAAFGDDYSVIRAGRYFLEAMAKGVDKGQGLKALGETIGITPDEMMGFGDEGNDLAMFSTVGLAVCMGNGSELAKAHADYITDTNDNDGISKAIEKFVLKA